MHHPSLKLFPLRVGHCRHLEWCSDRGARFAPVCFPANCALIWHPGRGWVLYDTGYSPHFFSATNSFPEILYRVMLPVTLPSSELLEVQLAALGITTFDIATCVISHFHADHIAGLRMFSKASFFASRAALDRAGQLESSRYRGILEGYLPKLLPDDFFERVRVADSSPAICLPRWMAPFERGMDLFGDGSAIAVPLEGHAVGQIGLLLPDVGGEPVFLAADACWSAPACKAGRLPGWPGMIISASRRKFVQTFAALSELMLREPSLLVLPSHCRSAWNDLARR